jgi:hypothetical protein
MRPPMHRTRPTVQHRNPSVCRWPPQRIATEGWLSRVWLGVGSIPCVRDIGLTPLHVLARPPPRSRAAVSIVNSPGERPAAAAGL